MIERIGLVNFLEGVDDLKLIRTWSAAHVRVHTSVWMAGTKKLRNGSSVKQKTLRKLFRIEQLFIKGALCPLLSTH